MFLIDCYAVIKIMFLSEVTVFISSCLKMYTTLLGRRQVCLNLLLLLFIRIMGALMAKMMAPLHNIQYTVCNVPKPIYIIYKSFLRLWLIVVLSTCRFSIGDCCEPATQP